MEGIATEKDVLEFLESRATSLKSELKRIEEALKALKGKSTAGNSEKERKKIEPPLVYDANYKWDKKILFALSSTGEAYTEDIVNVIYKLEPGSGREKLANLIAVKLSSLLKQGIISARREGRRFRYRLLGE